ncbi:UNVERIFIED_CONTAM: hypothetical protein Scaly_2434500 [Sesamum calycinum]|uniref:Retrovirus-related Pol polyprotein from transposon TNT 1-94-like beta-barrel domain-containing protein n=1 Tax=Sesamum calycinum TaxID=2727403 RepID=A0AAW2LZV5_9LAMI
MKKGKGKGKVGGYQQSKANDVSMHCQEKGHWKREYPQLLSNPGMFVIKVNMITNVASWVLDTGCGAHIGNNLQVLERSRRLSKDEIILRLGDGKAVAADPMGPLNLVISDHIWTELKDYYYVPSMMKNIVSIPILDNDGYTFTIDKNGFYFMIDNNSHLLAAAKLLNMDPSKTVPHMPYEIWHGKPEFYKYLRVWGSPQQNDATSFEPSVHGVPVFRKSTRESRPPERYEFVGLTSQLDNDPKIYGEAMPDFDSNKWLEAMKFEMDPIGSNQVWSLVDPLKSFRPVGCKWVYKQSLELTARLQPSSLGSWQKNTLNDPGSILRKPTRP